MLKAIQINKKSLYIIYSYLNFLFGKESSEKKTSKNFEMKVNSISKFDYKLFIALFFISLVPAFSVYADDVNYSVTVEPALNITTSSDKVSLDLNPLNHDFDSQDLTVSVSTNNETGYKLYVNATGNKLIEKDDTSLYIETLSTEVPENNFTTNRWGYRIGSGNYLPFESGILLNSSKTQIENNSSTLTFAAKVGYETKAGSYNLALNFQATANPHYKTIVDAEYLQEVSSKETGGCPADLTTGQSYPLKDSRDKRTYYVAKLKDGNCWMVQNLRLGQDAAVGSTITLDSDSSNVNGSFNLNGKLSNGKFTYSTIDGMDFQNNSSQYYCTNNYGCYYNWYAATAGSGTSSVTSGDVDYSICPAGWTLPTQTQFSVLTTAYGGTGATGYKAMLVNPTTLTENTNGAQAPGFLLTGYYGIDGYAPGSGYVWSRTSVKRGNQYALSFYPDRTAVDPAHQHVPYYGFSVRCLLK